MYHKYAQDWYIQIIIEEEKTRKTLFLMWGPAAAVAVPVAAPSSGTIKVPQQPEASDIECQGHWGGHIPPSHIPP